jgi:hypothetical protein
MPHSESTTEGRRRRRPGCATHGPPGGEFWTRHVAVLQAFHHENWSPLPSQGETQGQGCRAIGRCRVLSGGGAKMSERENNQEPRRHAWVFGWQAMVRGADGPENTTDLRSSRSVVYYSFTQTISLEQRFLCLCLSYSFNIRQLLGCSNAGLSTGGSRGEGRTREKRAQRPCRSSGWRRGCRLSATVSLGAALEVPFDLAVGLRLAPAPRALIVHGVCGGVLREREANVRRQRWHSRSPLVLSPLDAPALVRKGAGILSMLSIEC